MGDKAIQFEGLSIGIVSPTGAAEDSHRNVSPLVDCGERDSERLGDGVVLVLDGRMFEETVDSFASPASTFGAEFEVAGSRCSAGRDESGVAIAIGPMGVIRSEGVEAGRDDDDLPGVNHRVDFVDIGRGESRGRPKTEWTSWWDVPLEHRSGVVADVATDGIEIGEDDDIAGAKRPYHSGLGVGEMHNSG
jgi:hypothetical protein